MCSGNQIKIMALLMALFVFSVPVFAQADREEKGLNCESGWNGDRASRCVIKEQTIPGAGGIITVDGKKNGGVTVKGWERSEIFVRSKVQTWADSEAEASALINQIRIETIGANIYAVGPDSLRQSGWSVSYEVFVPFRSNLSLKTHNGGIGITDVRGMIEFDALNGGVSLRRLAGSVKGRTTNGGLSIDLTGTRWDGEGIDVKTMNGGVKLLIPEDYSARLETGTVNGGIKVNFPITLQGEIKRDLSINLGGGGPTIRVMTTNGGVTVSRKG